MAIKIAGVDVINDDRELVLAKLTDINETISSTAVDVFVYDTSKDSDGGAWRHRTQHTSWYNEGASSTRGSRAEFPAVAVIVAEAGKVTIYDGDDPSLPMWWTTRDTSTTNSLGILRFLNTYAVQAISMLNGRLVVGLDYTPAGDFQSNEGVHVLDFAADRAYKTTNSAAYCGYVGPLTSYPDTDITVSTQYAGAIVNGNINDVAMTVLPDAPTDPATGLPVPTIAVATDGGVSVIRDDGTVVDLPTSGVKTKWVGFNNANQLISQGNYNDRWVLREIPTVDLANLEAINTYIARPYQQYRQGAEYEHQVNFGDTYASDMTNQKQGLLLEHGANSVLGATSLVNLTTSDYATGWMNGDIKMAALADTDDTDLVGGAFFTETFGSAGSWEVGEGASISGGVLSYTGPNSTDSYVPDAIPRNSQIAVTFTVSNYASGNVKLRPGSLSSEGTAVSANGTYTQNMISTSNDAIVVDVSSNFVGDIDDIIVYECDPDRSANNNGLIINGSITKEPVATGADVVAYSGFDASNYLEQPYNSDLDFGTGDFCVMGWGKSSAASSNTYISYGTTGGVWQLNHDGSGTLTGYLSGPKVTYANINDGSWKYIALVRSSGTVYLYVNGSGR